MGAARNMGVRVRDGWLKECGRNGVRLNFGGVKK
jgi:hypothetical protein